MMDETKPTISDRKTLNPVVASSAVVSGPLRCVRCGYPLRGIGRTADCPECGLAVAESIETDIISSADTKTMRRVAAGALWWVLSFLPVVAAPLVFILAGPMERFVSDPLAEVFGYVVVGTPLWASLTWAWGLWRVTSVTQLSAWRVEFKLRRTARIASQIEAGIILLQYGTMFVFWSGLPGNTFARLIWFILLVSLPCCRAVALFAVARWIPLVEEVAGRGQDTVALVLPGLALRPLALLGAWLFALVGGAAVFASVTVPLGLVAPTWVGMLLFLLGIGSAFGLWFAALLAILGLLSLRSELKQQVRATRGGGHAVVEA